MAILKAERTESGKNRNANAVDDSVSDTPKGSFPKTAHLLKHSDFQRVYQQGRRHFSGNMTVFYLRSQAEAGPRAEPGRGRPSSGARGQRAVCASDSPSPRRWADRWSATGCGDARGKRSATICRCCKG